MNSLNIARKLWHDCNLAGLRRSLACSLAREYVDTRDKPGVILRDDMMWYGERVVQRRNLLFVKVVG